MCARVARGHVLQQNSSNIVQEYSSKWSFCNMLQILEAPGYTYNCLRLFSENGFEHVKWPAQVENHRCSPGLRS